MADPKQFHTSFFGRRQYGTVVFVCLVVVVVLVFVLVMSGKMRTYPGNYPGKFLV